MGVVDLVLCLREDLLPKVVMLSPRQPYRLAPLCILLFDVDSDDHTIEVVDSVD